MPTVLHTEVALGPMGPTPSFLLFFKHGHFEGGHPQSRQSAKFFLQSLELGLPNPSPARECSPPHPLVRGGGGRGTLTGEIGGGSQFQRGDIVYTMVLFTCMYFVGPPF
jgi:hypothetical protein